MNTFKEDLDKLKNYFNARNYKHLSEILEISYAAIDAWKRREQIPLKYHKFIQNNSKDYLENIKNDEIKENLKELIDELDDKKLEYYYHKIKSDILEEELK